MFKRFAVGFAFRSRVLTLAASAIVAACTGESTQPLDAAGGDTAHNGGANAGGSGGVRAEGGARANTGGSTTGGGASTAGGASSGGTSSGGTSSGGTSNAGGIGSAGAPGGGASNGGALSGSGGAVNSAGGRSAQAGSADGGRSTQAGGQNSGGKAGAAQGGASAGASSAGGAQGGAATGGAAAGGVATGGTAAGGAATGGTAAGGTATGSVGVRVVGRTAPGSAMGSFRFSWSGVSINARFMGTQVAMDLNDATNKNRFTVVVDGGAPRTVTTSSGQSTLQLATGLANAAHDLVVWRNTEASQGVTLFTALSNFGNGGALLPPAAAPQRRIEVIGDSISVGAGVEGNASCPGGIDAFTNDYLAYGSVAARSVNADVVTIAWSGIGVYRNYDGGTANTMPSRYPYAIPNDATAWDFSRYQPHVVVINLGTNDFGQGDPGTAYESAYVTFVKSVRAKYPSTQFLLADMYGGTRLTRINNVVAALKSGGESKVDALSFSSVQNNLGCNQHPNSAAHAAMGAALATRLKSLMGW